LPARMDESIDGLATGMELRTDSVLQINWQLANELRRHVKYEQSSGPHCNS
jgi:hypothetical protein